MKSRRLLDIILQLGYVIARVYTSEAEIPVKNAVFSVESVSQDKILLYGIRTTDENGKTTPVPIETPDIEKSLSPGVKKPYTTVNVRISHPDYISKYITGVQVFADTVSVQESSMLPINSNISSYQSTEKFVISDSEL